MLENLVFFELKRRGYDVFIGKNAEYKQAVVSKVMDNGTFMIVGSDEVHKLAGVDFNNYDDSSQELLSQFIGPGAQVTIATDSNQYHKYDSNGNVNATLISEKRFPFLYICSAASVV